MKFRFSLRYRVALAFLLLGWLISMAMGGTLYWLTINLEEEFIEETLSSELEDYIKRYTIDPETLPPSSNQIQGYVINEKAPKNFPKELRKLPVGLSHVTMSGSGYYVELRKHNKLSFLVLYDDTFIKHREKQYLGFLAAGIGLITLLSSFLGLWLAGRVISPITKLASHVSRMGPNYGPLSLSTNHPDDEVGELALAIDDYQQRLAGYNERERSFTSDVSHELRTPLAIIEGATEVLLTNKELSKENRKIAERIARATKQITRLTTALLALAREETENKNLHQYPVDKILRQVVDEHLYLLHHKPVEVKLNTDSNLINSGDPALLYMVLANIVRNAFSYTLQGVVHIRIINKSVIINDTGYGMKEDQLPKMFERRYRGNSTTEGHGIGLSIVKRICDRFGWKISVTSHQGKGTSIELLLN